MPDLTNVLNQFASRYRSAVLATAGVWAALCLSISAAAVWRLRALELSPLWRLGLPAAAALSGVGAAAWWLRRRWWSERDAAGQLDRALDLDQRLITAQEFANASPPPALYPLLLEDTAQRYTADRIRLPRPLNPLSGGLTAVLLALLLWPQAAPPARMAQLPHPPPQPTPPEGSPAAEPSSGEGPSAPSSGPQRGAPQSSPSSGSEARKDQQPQQAGGGSSSPQDRPQDAPSRQEQRRQQPSKPQARGKGQEQDDGGKGESSQQKDGSASEQTASASGASAPSQQGSRSQGQQRGQGQQPQGAQSSEQPGGRSSGDQEALREEIRELLKDVSGELQQLQAQLAAAQEGQQPSAGTSTDADLYGAAEPPLPSGAGSQMPIQLETDREPSKTRRSGQGTGRPSGEVSDEGPQTQAEAAELSDQPLAESAASRQPIPPAYRSIFDRLQQPEGAPQP